MSNISAMTRHIASRGINLRPHVKTCKSIDVAALALKDNFGGITVATLNEAEYFAGHGVRDILYGVCITPDKLSRISKLLKDGVCITVITDSIEVATVLAGLEIASGPKLKVMVEIDCGEHRTGVSPADPLLIEPLPPPPNGSGFQVQQPPRPMPGQSESETCASTFYDLTKTELVPPEWIVPCPPALQIELGCSEDRNIRCDGHRPVTHDVSNTHATPGQLGLRVDGPSVASISLSPAADVKL